MLITLSNILYIEYSFNLSYNNILYKLLHYDICLCNHTNSNLPTYTYYTTYIYTYVIYYSRILY